MSLRRRLLAVGALFLVLAGSGLGYLAVRSLRPPEQAARLVPGRRLVYELEYVSVSASDFSRLLAEGPDDKTASPGLSRSAHTAVTGTLEITVLGKDARARLAYRLAGADVQLAVDGELDAERGKVLQGDLEKPLLVEVDPRGRVLAVRLGAGGLTSSLSRSLLAATQVVWPEHLGERTWEVEEEGPTGAYQARYEATPGDEAWAVRKTRLRYRAPRTVPSIHEFAAPLQQRPSGHLEAKVDVRRGRLLALEGTEATALVVQDRTVGRAETTLRLKFLREETASEQELAALQSAGEARAATNIGLSEREDEDKGEMALQRAELGEATVEELLAELAKPGEKDETALYLKLKAVVYLRPSVATQLGARLLEADARGPALRVLTQALAGSGRPEAQKVLASVVRARANDWPALAEMLPALGLARSPTLEAEEVLREMAERGKTWDVRSTAQLALGVMARNLAAKEPARAAGIVRWAVAELEGAPGPDLRRQMLLVLGNAGAAEALPAVRPHLRAKEPEVRGAALAALRWLEGAEVEADLAGALTADSDDSVRLEATHALELRAMTATALRAHLAAFRNDKSVTVRLAVLSNLARARDNHPEAVRALREALGDTVKEVREAAARLQD